MPVMDNPQKRQFIVAGVVVLLLSGLTGIVVSLFAGNVSDSALPVAWTPRATPAEVARPAVTATSPPMRATSAPAATATSRPSPTPSQPPPTETRPPTQAVPSGVTTGATGGASPTALPATATPQPTATATATPVPTRVPPTPRPTVTTRVLAAARAPTPTREVIASPILLWPEPEANLGGLVPFRWEPLGPLPPAAGYEVVAWQPGEAPAAARGLAAPTQADTLTIDLDALARANQLPGTRLLWAVIVVQTEPYVRLTQPEASRARLINYLAPAPPAATEVPPTATPMPRRGNS